MTEDKQGPKTPSPSLENQRLPYVPPRVRFVEILVEEALLSICKSGSSAGPTGACAIPCYNDGS